MLFRSQGLLVCAETPSSYIEGSSDGCDVMVPGLLHCTGDTHVGGVKREHGVMGVAVSVCLQADGTLSDADFARIKAHSGRAVTQI